MEHVANVLLAQERGFNIDLGEFGLAVGAQVFVAETFGDLVITVVTGHHQELLEELRALGQREKMTVVHTAGHQVVARAFGRAFGEHGRFNIYKPVGI